MSTAMLIPDWRKAWRFTSVRAAALLALLSMAQTDVLPLLQGLVPARFWPWITLGFAVAIVILRVLAQPALDAEEKPTP